MEPESLENLNDDDLKIAFDYANDISYDDIVKKYSFLHTRKDVSIRIRRAIKKMGEVYEYPVSWEAFGIQEWYTI